MRNLSTKVNDTAPSATGILDAAEFNSSQDELETAVSAGSITLDAALGPDSRTNMLAESIARHVSSAIFCTDTGSANTYVADVADSNVVAPKSLFLGLTIRFKPGNASTGAATCNGLSLGVKPIVNHVYAPLTSGAIDGREIDLRYYPSVGSGSWVLPAYSNALYVGQTPSSPPAISSGEGWAVDGSNFGNLNFPGLTADATPLAADTFAFHDAADSEHKSITYAALSGLLGTGGGIVNVQFLTASGTYTKTAGTTKALVFAVGGGGGGGGAQYAKTAGGGGAGALAFAFADVSGAAFAYTIGAGGAGGVSGGGNGGAGGSTQFGSFATAGGGDPGRGDAPEPSGNCRGGRGGTASVGTATFGGDSGEASSPGNGGKGGCSFFGGGGLGGHTQGDYVGANGSPGAAYGAGGGGADSVGTGGAGAAGCILVVEFK
jgi:hypothetical protein